MIVWGCLSAQARLSALAICRAAGVWDKDTSCNNDKIRRAQDACHGSALADCTYCAASALGRPGGTIPPRRPHRHGAAGGQRHFMQYNIVRCK